MWMKRWIVPALIAAAIGCGGSSSNNSGNSDGGTASGDGGTTPGGGPEQLTAFARNLVEAQTSDGAMPAEVASLTFAADNEDPNTFEPAFFQ